jgi:hypothetical protein
VTGRFPEAACGELLSEERMWDEEFMVRVLRWRLSWLGEKRVESHWSGVRRGVRSSGIIEM